MIGLLAAAAAGAVAGVLLAPHKGSKTRRKLSKKSRETVEGIKNSYNNFKDTVTDKFNAATDHVPENNKRTVA